MLGEGDVRVAHDLLLGPVGAGQAAVLHMVRKVVSLDIAGSW